MLGNLGSTLGNSVGSVVSPLVADYMKGWLPSFGAGVDLCAIHLEELTNIVEKKERKLISLKSEVLDSNWLDWAIPVGAFIFSFFVVYDFVSKSNKRKRNSTEET
jgi:hypothetical protein